MIDTYVVWDKYKWSAYFYEGDEKVYWYGPDLQVEVYRIINPLWRWI